MKPVEMINKGLAKKSTIYRVKKQISKRKTIKRKKGSKGYKKLLKSHKLKIYNALKQNPFRSAIDLVNFLGLPVTARTVRNYLKATGFRYRRPDTKIKLDQDKKRKRVDFCKKMETFLYINSIIFSDEASFWIFDNNHCGWFHNNVRQELSVECHAGKVHAWGAISARGKINLVTFTDTLTASFYQDILDEHLISQAWDLYPKTWYFQQDKDSKHTAHTTQNYLEDNISHLIDWPAKSPDLNPMENIWSILKGNTKKRQPKTVMELEECIHEEWERLSTTMIKDLAKSFRKCIKFNGSVTHY